MKDIIISGSRIKTELTFLFWCYFSANMLNVFSIWFYESRWIELLTYQGLVVVIALFFYGLSCLFRSVWYLIGKIIKRDRNVP